MKTGVVGYNSGNWVSGIVMYIDKVDDIKNVDMIVLPGGADIHPSFYGDKRTVKDGVYSEHPDGQDRYHWACIKEAVRLGKGIFGICRGAQMLCAYAGGKLFHHVEGHGGGRHMLVTSEGQEFESNSAHHQAMRLSDQGILLAQTKIRIAKERYDQDGLVDVDEPEVEAAAWPDINAVGVQGHPEWGHFSSDLAKYSRKLIEDYITI